MFDLGLCEKEAKLVFLGLDNAGKTTLLNLLATNELRAFTPTQQPTMEEFTLGRVNFRTYDLGGHQMARRIWNEYSAEADGIIFLVDSADQSRFDEAAQEIRALIDNEAMSETPILILGNKIDLPESVGEGELCNRMGLDGFQGRASPHAIYMCSLVKKQGYKEGIQWLSQHI